MIDSGYKQCYNIRAKLPETAGAARHKKTTPAQGDEAFLMDQNHFQGLSGISGETFLHPDPAVIRIRRYGSYGKIRA